MNCRFYLLFHLLSLLGLFSLITEAKGSSFTKGSFTKVEILQYRDEVKNLFLETMDNYMSLGFPYDELRPISCVPKMRNVDDIEDVITNDVLGNFTVTMIDSLTTYAIMGEKRRFEELISIVRETYSNGFDIDSIVQVFETTIRIIGSLLSSHLYASDPSKIVYIEDYDGFLLDLAKDMADRLLPAYLTNTGLPVSRINLKKVFQGIPGNIIEENNVAAMGCPMFEFTLLSYLTKDKKYEKITRYAFDKVWSLRSNLDLLPMSLNPQSLQIFSIITGIGASIDSFFEYALKGAILFNDSELYNIWVESYRALNVNLNSDWFYINGQHINGQLGTFWIDSLSAFFPGLQVLNGDIEDATLKNLMSLKLWDTFGGIPERWQFQSHQNSGDMNNDELLKNIVPLEWYPLRPEFVESTYFLYRATKDPFYLNTGYRILNDLKTRFKYNCGLGGIQNVITGEPQDRMESFVLSETLKYLYLLFDEQNELHASRDNFIFSTEAHPMWLTPEVIKDYKVNGFFNDTRYENQLKRLKDNDKRFLENVRKKGKASKGLIGLVKSLFKEYNNDETSDLSAVEFDENQYINKNVFNLSCPITPFMQSNKNDGESLLKSYLLSNFDRLFEIDYRYNDTLIKPAHLKEYRPIELEDDFYQLWMNPRKSISRPASSTESFEIAIELEGNYELTKYKNGSVYCSDLAGRRRIRIEKIQAGSIDTYGEVVPGKTFTNVHSKDVTSSSCDLIAESYSHAILYRATSIDGIPLPSNGEILISKGVILSKQENIEGGAKSSKLLDLFGLNQDDQMMLDCIPIINIRFI
ncbi:hypothetical protein Kpol_1000p15 [Vanderwaltozyma polyspora DSM 70294]|uniref:alpha-1,2-Mannosidase n=1 Tax=Vanderwaltozyma polyspora (strain ATCC 22028 / DSM 70294 / BCRC 21397 / CBS 2163 / NBRC 10782 / NRRL Y-8283 / UCD 57-17) TaxID=436907 RepID=A7TPV5_VANPO|nr:uncharacterized protein Kpol_1000p15 [Vanderwaltozyma polyspora DSM 70294]EDO15703.1 hypothetical protein Kpol_1000p15 [Vanderwaltozyma polyspora DSM 70294]